jgi:hypothetical protein
VGALCRVRSSGGGRGPSLAGVIGLASRVSCCLALCVVCTGVVLVTRALTNIRLQPAKPERLSATPGFVTLRAPPQMQLALTPP